MGLRAMFGPVVHNHLPLLSLYAGVAFAAWYGGYGAGLLVAVLGYLAAHFLDRESGTGYTDALVYAAGSLLLIVLGAELRNALVRAAERQKLLEREVRERLLAEEKLREADRRKDEFLALLAHELRNPLHPISASV